MQKPYTSFLDYKNYRFVYIPIDENGEYAMLTLRLNRSILRLFRAKNVGAAGILGFFFIPNFIMFFIIFLGLFFFLGTNKKLAKKLHLLIPVIVYLKMSPFEVSEFLKDHPEFGKSKPETYESVPSQISEQEDLTIEQQKPFINEESNEKLKKQTPTHDQSLWGQSSGSNSQENTESSKTDILGSFQSEKKSIFDDYESVMDKFDKKK